MTAADDCPSPTTLGAGDLAIELIDLDDDRALPASVGAKAARLAAARRRGLPVLPGFVVLAGPGRSLVGALLPELATRGPHAVSLTLMEKVPEVVDLSAAVVAAERLAPSLVARSSSEVEDDPLWSGAFSSYLELSPDQLVTAVAGCWASALTPSVIELCERTGAAPADVCPAVLVQPMLEPEASGTATFAAGSGAAGAAGAVEIVAVWGAPGPLMAGWSEGWRATVVGDEVSGPATGGPATGGPATGGRASTRRRPPDRPFPTAWLRAVAELARQACAGAPAAIEWAVVDGRPVLLQARPAVVGRRGAGDGTGGGAGNGAGMRSGSALGAAAGATIDDHTARDPDAARVARAVIRYGGPLGDRLVLPWLLGMAPTAPEARSGPPQSAGVELLARFEAAARDAGALVAEAMGSGAEEGATAGADGAASRFLSRVAAGELEALHEVRPVDAERAAAILATLAETGAALVDQGALAHPEQLWSLSVDEVQELLLRPVAGGWLRHRHRTLRWQALAQRVVTLHGRHLAGEGVSPGVAAGPARRLSGVQDLRRVVPGDVVVLHRPSPQLAPALWVAGGLVAESGSGAAHLIEVARSLRVPAVVGVGIVEVAEGEDLVCVDGDGEDVAVLGAEAGPNQPGPPAGS